VRTDLGDVDELLDDVADAHARVGALGDRLDRLARARELVDAVSVQLGDPAARRQAEQLRRILADLHQGLGEGIDHLDRELRQVRDAAERLRLVPVATLLRTLEHAARDVARAQGKALAFHGHGADLRLDAHLVATLRAALEQIVRNAVAHGIAPPEERRAAGKDPEGTVTVTVVRRGQRAVVTCTDDGRGIDVAAVQRVARERGLVDSEDGALGPDALLRLLLTGGLSTSGEVTEVSGRGIGLDIARDAVERLGGSITAHTTPGQGTTVEVDVPLALSSLPALVVEVDDHTAVVPLDAVRRIVRVQPDELLVSGGGRALVHDGTAMPFVPLAELVGGGAARAPDGAWSAVIIESPAGAAALGVSRTMARTSVVVQPLPELAPPSPLVSGVSLDVQGDPLLVLDAGGLVAAAGRSVTAVVQESPRPPILVVDDSLTTRMLEQTILESAGYDVDVAVSGEDALEQVERRRYGLLLVDVEMPGIDGFTTIERLRGHPTLGDTPCIFVTSRANPEDLQRAERLGAHAYMVKSQFDQQALLAHIREVVGG
jgi:two-component system chemotaxis sensor kinase CheA